MTELKKIDLGIKNIEARLQDQLILVEGTAAPSSIVSAIQTTGRDAILRGSGTSNSKTQIFHDLSRISRCSISNKYCMQVLRCAYSKHTL